MTTSTIVVSWCDEAQMMEKAKARGWTDDGLDGPSIHDLVDEGDCERDREFTTLSKAKDWARRNKTLDFWGQPSIRVYEWPDQRRLSWQRETVKRLRYVGDGCGWEDLT